MDDWSIKHLTSNPNELTPIQRVGGIMLKRDDLFHVKGVRGGKVRTCWYLSYGADGLITAGARHSPQVSIVSRIAQHLDVPCRVHVPRGKETMQIIYAEQNGAEIIRHFPGYNTVIVARARDDALTHSSFTEIPFGMECWEAVNQTRKQTLNIPSNAKRIVVPVGSGMTLAGVLWGLKDMGLDLPVLGVSVGANPERRLDHYAPKGWRRNTVLTVSESGYHDTVHGDIGGIDLDPIYEAKCLPHLMEDDLFWVIGHRDLIPESLHLNPTPPIKLVEEQIWL